MAHLLKVSEKYTIVSEKYTIGIGEVHYYYSKSPLLIFGLFFQ